MYKGLSKLAKLIKLMGKDIAKDDSWWKTNYLGPVLSMRETDQFFDEISVTDDSGYRSITIGDTRGNVSRVNGRRIKEEEHRGYMLLYSENSYWENEKRKWKYSCFPSQKEIERRLQAVIDEIPLISEKKNNCDSEEYWYERKDKEALRYLSTVVKEYADRIATDSRTPEQILADAQL